MSGTDQMTDSAELHELRDAVSGITIPARPRLEAITERGRVHRRRRRLGVARLSVAGAVAVTGLVLTVTGAHRQALKLGTIRTASFTLHKNADSTDTLTLTPGELLDPSALQSDFAKYGIPAKVTSGSYCSSAPEPAGFAQAVTGPGPGTWQEGSGEGAKGSGATPTITIDPSQIPAGTELTVGDFQLPSGEQRATFSLMNSSSYTCTGTPPGPSEGDIGVLYGGPGPS